MIDDVPPSEALDAEIASAKRRIGKVVWAIVTLVFMVAALGAGFEVAKAISDFFP